MPFFQPDGNVGSQYCVRVTERLEETEGIPWNALRRPVGIYQHPGWLAVAEEMATGPVRYLTAWSSDHGSGCMGVAPLYLFRPGDSAGLYDPRVTLGENVAQSFGVSRGFTVIGGRAGYFTGWAILGSKSDDYAFVISSILESGAGVSESLGAGLLSVQFLPRREALLLVQSGIVQERELAPQIVQALIRLNGSTFDDYLDGVSQARRSTIKRDLAKFRASGLRLTSSSLEEALDYAPSLLAKVQAHHGAQADADLMRKMLETQARHLDASSLIIAARDASNTPVAYSLSYIVDDGLYVRLVGLDHDRAAASAAYFTTAYYEPINEAYRRNLKVVHLGIGSLRPKALRGATLEPLFGFFRGRDGSELKETQVSDIAYRLRKNIDTEIVTMSGGLDLALR